MKDRIFIDSNIFLYLLLNSENIKEKREKVIRLFSELNYKDIFISTQVINETYNVLIRYKVNDLVIQENLAAFFPEFNFLIISKKTIEECWKLRIKHKFSYYDSLILASALESECSILYSEDMQHNYKVGKNLIIKNPFIEF